MYNVSLDVNWFLYDRDLRHERVKGLINENVLLLQITNVAESAKCKLPHNKTNCSEKKQKERDQNIILDPQT